MIKDKDGKEVVYWIGGSAGICPKCGNGNAMLDVAVRTTDGLVYDLECRDCGHHLHPAQFVNVAISYDAEARVYTGNAAKGLEVPTEVELAPFDDPMTNRPDIKFLMDYLKDYPTPDTW